MTDHFPTYRQRIKARWQTRTLMRKYRCGKWWDSWTEAELREAWGR